MQHRSRLPVAQGGCGVSVLGDIQNPVGHSPGQPTLCRSAVNRSVRPEISRGPFQPEPFCDFVIAI